MKTILVINKPKNCDDCQLMHSYYDYEYGWIKRCIGSGVNDCVVLKRKLEDYCPLKSLEENYISIDWLKNNIIFRNEKDRNYWLNILDVWRERNESNISD